MTSVQQIEDFVRMEVPQAALEVERYSGGTALLNIRFNGKFFVVQCRPTGGFALWLSQSADPFEGYGEKPDETFEQFAALRGRLLELLQPAAAGAAR